MVEEGGFEPPKSMTANLQSAPFAARSSQNPLAADNVESFLTVVVEMIRVCRLLRRYLINTDRSVLGFSKGHKFAAIIFVSLMFVFMTLGDIVDRFVFDLAHRSFSPNINNFMRRLLFGQ